MTLISRIEDFLNKGLNDWNYIMLSFLKCWPQFMERPSVSVQSSSIAFVVPGHEHVDNEFRINIYLLFVLFQVG